MSEIFKAMMANYGIQTQTPTEVEPVEIWNSAELVKVRTIQLLFFKQEYIYFELLVLKFFPLLFQIV